MPKHIYIIIAGIFAFEYFPTILPGLKDMLTMLSLAWCFFGLFYYSKVKPNKLNSRKNHRYTYWILFLLFLSCISPVFTFNQSFVGTLLAVRTVPIILYLNVFLMMQPTEEDFYKAFKVLGLASVGMTLYATYTNPYIFIDPEIIDRKMAWMASGETMDIFIAKPGQMSVIFLFFLSASRMLKSHVKRLDVLLFLISVAYLFVGQNRSTLLIVAPFTVYVLFKAKFKFKFLLVGCILLACGAFAYQIIDSLMLESQEQLADDDYARWKALRYFLQEWPYGVYTFLFGHGQPCAGSPYLRVIEVAKDKDMYASDIGMIGTFFHYGFILTAMLYAIMIKGLRKFNPMFIRFFALWVILVPTIHHFGLSYGSTQLKFAIIIYLVMYYKSINIPRKSRKKVR